MFARSKVLAGLVAMIAFAAPARAFDVQPTVSVIELPKDSKGKTLVVQNPRTIDLPLSFEVVERTVNEDGTETTKPATDLFVIFPPQTVIGPGKTQTIRVQWAGPAVSGSRSFTLFAAEQDVAMPDTESGVKTLFKMGASIHVASADAVAKPTLVAAVAEKDGVRVTIANEGNCFFYLNDLALDFPNGKTVEGVDLANIAERTLVTPGARRTFIVPKAEGQPTLRVVDNG